MSDARTPLVRWIVDLLLPRHCLACGAPLGGGGAPLGLCRRCHGRLVPIDARRHCQRCLQPLPLAAGGAVDCLRCAMQPPPLRRTVAVWWYQDPLRSVVHAFKFRRLDFLAEALTREALTREPLAGLPAINCVVPVPLALGRRLGRGYNQAERIAAEVARALDAPVLQALARAPFATRHQSRLGRRARHLDVARGWGVQRAAAPRLVGSSVLLADDVVTTGATLATAATLLQRAGAREIFGFALAATPERTRGGPLQPT